VGEDLVSRAAMRQRGGDVAVVPDAMNTAVSLPSKSATRAHSAFTVGSSPICSSPTGALAIASRIAGLGVVCVSENRLIRIGGRRGSSGTGA